MGLIAGTMLLLTAAYGDPNQNECRKHPEEGAWEYRTDVSVADNRDRMARRCRYSKSYADNRYIRVLINRGGFFHARNRYHLLGYTEASAILLEQIYAESAPDDTSIVAFSPHEGSDSQIFGFVFGKNTEALLGVGGRRFIIRDKRFPDFYMRIDLRDDLTIIPQFVAFFQAVVREELTE